MTGEEAIELLRRMEYYDRPFDNSIESSMNTCKLHKAVNMAIKALEQGACDDTVSQKLDEWDLCGKRAELWIIRGKLQIRYMGTVHNINYPPVTPTQRWIPVSERLPEEHLCDDGYVEPSDYVLVLGDHGNYGVSRYWGNRRSKPESPNTHKDWVDLDWMVQKPIAWMPLPEPYKAERKGVI